MRAVATITVAICFVLFIADQTSKTAATFAAAVGRSCSVEIITFGMNNVQWIMCRIKRQTLLHTQPLVLAHFCIALIYYVCAEGVSSTTTP